jgi:hypothetical protein
MKGFKEAQRRYDNMEAPGYWEDDDDDSKGEPDYEAMEDARAEKEAEDDEYYGR